MKNIIFQDMDSGEWHRFKMLCHENMKTMKEVIKEFIKNTVDSGKLPDFRKGGKK